MEKREENLLDILAEERIHTALQNILDESDLYKCAEREVDESLNELEKAGLSRKQNMLVDKALSATNASGAAYGTTAYKQGLYDGIKLMTEVKQINQVGSILNEQKLGCEKVMEAYEEDLVIKKIKDVAIMI